MINVKGKEYKAGILKLALDDQILDILDWLTKMYQQPTNKHTIAMLIIEKYKETVDILKAREAQAKIEEKKDEK